MIAEFIGHLCDGDPPAPITAGRPGDVESGLGPQPQVVLQRRDCQPGAGLHRRPDHQRGDLVGGFDAHFFPMYCDDVDISWRLRLAGWKVRHAPRAAIFHDKRITIDGAVAISEFEITSGTLARLCRDAETRATGVRCGLMDPYVSLLADARGQEVIPTVDAIEALEVPPDLQAAFDEYSAAGQNFEAFPRSVKRGILEWIANAKRPATRRKRVEETARLAQANIRANQWRR